MRFFRPTPAAAAPVHSHDMRSNPSLLVSVRLLLRSSAVVVVALAAGRVDAAVHLPDTAMSRLADAARGLVESSPRSTPPLVKARADGHLAELAGSISANDLRRHRTPRERLAWLETALGPAGLDLGSDRDRARAATRLALDLLAEAAPDDPAVVHDRWVSAVLAGDATLTDGSIADLTARPFPMSPETACDRLAAGGEAIQLAMLDRADRAALPAVVAAILAAESAPTDAVTARINAFDHSLGGIGPDVVLELAGRSAGLATLTYVRRHPEAIRLPGIRVAAIAAVAADDPAGALELAGGETVLDRLPARGSSAIRIGLARGLRDVDRDTAITHVELAGQLDDRIVAMLAIRRPTDDPDRTLEDIKSCRTVLTGRLVAALTTRILDREQLVEGMADLFRTGRYDLAYTMLLPNTTEPNRPADDWMPTRLTILSDALARADAAPDAWIPLLESVPRSGRVDGQVAALAAVARGLTAVLPTDADLPEPLRAVLSDTLVEIALRG